MRIFVAGGTGAVGKQLVPLLVRSGHRVVATTRSPAKAAALREAGAEPVVVDGLDREALLRAVVSARPEAVVQEMTAFTGVTSFKNLDASLALSNRLRTEGTRNLLDAARDAGARRFVAQSFTGWPNAREGAPVKLESDALDSHPAPHTERTLEAIRTLESLVLASTSPVGVVLRYGAFYGPGTDISPGGAFVEAVRRRRLPVVGGGGGIWSFVHIADVAEATRAAVEAGPAGTYHVVDDEPAAVSIWLPELARDLGAKPPYRVPAWLGRLAIGEAGVRMMTQQRGASNAKAKRQLGWRPLWPSWREGFRNGLSSPLTGPSLANVR